jgi:uncharacterized membrane protein (UPF0127 family)
MKLLRRNTIAAVALVLYGAGASAVCAQETFSSEPLQILHANGKSTTFDVELALTPNQKQQGLMFRRTMAPNHGMLFDFQENRLVSMWMRNTYLPLDMIFASQSGQITHIHENAIPHDESVITSRGQVRFVLELNAGAAKRFDIRIGDQMVSGQIKKAAN